MTGATVTQPITVLLVEDNPGDARLILEMLRELPAEDFDLERVDRLAPALERLGSAGVDIVLLDLGLPDSEGIETFWRTHREAPREPIVVISGLDDERVALEAVRAGAQDYLVKGRIEGELLARVIHYAIERNRSQEALRRSEARFQGIIDAALDAVITMDGTGVIRSWSTQAEQTFGWPAAEAIGRSLATTIVPPRHRDAHERGLTHFLKTGDGPVLNRRFEITGLHRDGREFPVELAITPVRLGGEWVFSAFVRDITEHRRAERRRTAQYAVTGILAAAATLQDAASGILRAIGEALDWQMGLLWMRDREREVLRCVEIWHRADLAPDEFARASREAAFARDVGLPGMVLAKGGPLWFREVAELPEGQFPRRALAIAAGIRGAFAFPIRSAAGITGVAEFFSSELREPDPDLVEMTAALGSQVGEFIERKGAEEALRRSEEQLRQAQKMEAVGRLAGGVAHDFNNVLTAIFGYAELLTEEFPAGSTARQDLEEIRKAATRASALTRQLLAFSRQQVLEPVVLSVNDLVEDVDKMLRRLVGEDVELRVSLAANSGNVRADPGQLQQVIMNLVVNARDAMPTGGKLLIETAYAELTEQYAELHQPVVPGRYVMIAISDTGVGMDAGTRARIFEPFFTTKEKGKGTGLGLSTVYGIVKQSGGYVWVYSEPRHGTTFKVYLPRVDAAAEHVPPPREAATLTGTETILLAEDDEILRPLAKGVLTKLGYTVLETESTEQALAAAAAHTGPIPLLLTDVVMPGASGRELARRLAQSHPETRVLYMSGYTDDAIVRHGMLEPGLTLLQKPFTPAALARKVREVLDAP
jgi:two-component system, cell cycle sensor histidine kinase and response regulator CckA